MYGDPYSRPYPCGPTNLKLSPRESDAISIVAGHRRTFQSSKVVNGSDCFIITSSSAPFHYITQPQLPIELVSRGVPKHAGSATFQSILILCYRPSPYHAAGSAHRMFVDGRINHVFDLYLDGME